MTCFFLSDSKVCKLGIYPGEVQESQCAECMHYSGRDRGVGDSLARVFKAVGAEKIVGKKPAKPCGCGKRRAKLNKLIPYKEAQDGD